ncbi:MAG: 1-aminocyclopropane-1-carboxylate deaminase/D-cysteine desulfhydrase [Campylobacterales bacterium]|nr:1-aminocyclopropane-1-carboxylate deaminase/D-cysteine desulfhydrase [Campylobacterales bacterium]
MYKQKLNYSPIEQITFEEHAFYLKRDDFLHPDFSGNKARKFLYFLQNDFPSIKKIVSYGSIQSNAMYSLSVLAKMKKWEFEYFVDHIPDYLKANPHGNYQAALNNGMKVYVGQIDTRFHEDKSIVFIEEGGRQKEAEFGIRQLAQEIIKWQKEQQIPKLNVFLPSGTGTTALFLQKNCSLLHTDEAFQTTVFTTPCVGDGDYLKKQFLQLEDDETLHPNIATPDKKYHFGKLYKDNYKIWLKLQQQTGIEFDLLYDPIGWLVLLSHPEIYSLPTLYIHQGGILGNESMLPRYQRKYPLVSEK